MPGFAHEAAARDRPAVMAPKKMLTRATPIMTDREEVWITGV
jgi:hypothetical protein